MTTGKNSRISLTQFIVSSIYHFPLRWLSLLILSFLPFRSVIVSVKIQTVKLFRALRRDVRCSGRVEWACLICRGFPGKKRMCQMSERGRWRLACETVEETSELPGGNSGRWEYSTEYISGTIKRVVGHRAASIYWGRRSRNNHIVNFGDD